MRSRNINSHSVITIVTLRLFDKFNNMITFSFQFKKIFCFNPINTHDIIASVFSSIPLIENKIVYYKGHVQVIFITSQR